MNAVSDKTDAKQTDADGDPVYRKNPHPTQAYRVTMTIEDAPGPFGYVGGTAFYDMANHKQCTPVEPIEGVWRKPSEGGIPIQFKKVSETEYEGTIYADGMVDADYYGKGICRFELTGVGVTLSATGKHEETRFQPALFKHEIHGFVPRTTYFWKGGYPRSNMENYPDSGEDSVDKYAEPNRSNLFRVTLKTEKVTS